MTSDTFPGEVTKKLKEILGFKSFTHTLSSLQRNKRNIFPCGKEDSAKRMGAPLPVKKRSRGESQGEGERHGIGRTTEGCDCPHILDTSQAHELNDMSWDNTLLALSVLPPFSFNDRKISN